MKRWICFIFILILLSCTPLFAGNLFGESTSEESWALEHSSVNNDNKYWDIIQTLIPNAPSQQYSAVANSELLRIRTNYGRTYTNNKYRTVKITPVGGSWVFTADNNITVTRAYTFDLYEICWTRSGREENAVASGNPTKVNPTTDTTSAVYTFTMKSAEWNTWGTDYVKKFYDYEIVLRLPELTQTERDRLEPGEYHATFKVTLYTGSNGGSEVTYEYTIKAVYGQASGANTEYSFSLDEVSSTYNVDLTKTNQYFEVVGIRFHASGLSTENKSESQIENAYKNKYKVLISPYPQYDSDNTSNDNPYMFILNGTDNLPRSEINTVWYTLASNTNGTALSLYDSSKYKHTYVLTPTVDASGTSRNWVLSWDLNQSIYIKPVAATTAVTRANGFYHTTLYFYVVTNT